ncbi:hypothetical protein Tsubulata_042484 [Turnera subulata]|uniref:YDG domain-containing protein n=1 Tax=Turnera subulata TaxID=218843 RepID=A0A9Q0FEK3_9ROSI|nr:hypothetical protein Tsubulata_042484 [Turnera subulata]
MMVASQESVQTPTPACRIHGEQSCKKQNLGSVSYNVSSAKGKSVALVGSVKRKGNGLNVGGHDPHPSNESSQVKEVLKLFWEEFNKLKEETGRKALMHPRSIIIKAAMSLKNKWLNAKKILGHVPGVEIGHKFQLRAELRVIGAHCQFEKGTDYMKMEEGTTLATSIVATSRYANIMEKDSMVYIGQGENPGLKHDKPVKDQKLVRGNLALKNSCDSGTPVRVIRLVEPAKNSKLSKIKCDGGEKNKKPCYVYDGLYFVSKWSQSRSKSGKLIFIFELERWTNQPLSLSKG